MRLRVWIPLALGMLLSPLPAMAEVVPLDRIVAVVNDDAIMHSQLESRVAQARDQLRSNNIQMPPEQALERQVLDRMIVEQIELQMADDAKLSIDETQLNTTMRGIAKNNGMSLEAFADTLEKQGQSLAEVREQVRRELLVRQVQQSQVASKITVSDREVDRFLAQRSENSNMAYHLAQILIAVPQSPTPDQVTQAQAEAQKIYQQLQDGADFQQLAVAESDDAQALQGGDLGWRQAAQIPTVFADVIPDLSKGQVSEPIRSPSGFHLVKLLDTRGGGSEQMSRDQASQAIFERKVNDEIEAWIQEIRASAYIDNRLDKE
ncbi:peptidylprolyl isomerase [Salinicola sp. MH3R3-1]|uniref:peptidylprolyl isomerase n=1 Tax=Salinicola sp. MH3R3-1 TaxID=1928762 RepID=UPI00094ECEBE|nr:peptidylprolyl isomerase [Salinicola sp. MH3R3-1]OLO06611.1 peptidylprolyl isomerase [Salinicola sp. MH3R3-1]